MKIPVINIFTSKDKNMIHYVYRSQDKPIEKTLEEFISNRTPIGMIDEAVEPVSSIQINEMTMLKDNHPKNNKGYIQLSLPFNFNLGNNKYNINLRNNANGDNDITIEIELGANALLSAKILEENITLNDIIFRNNAILIPEDIPSDYNVITFTGDIPVFKFQDAGEEFEVVTPERGHGIYKPILRVVETSKYFQFYQDADYRKNIYYYYVISKDRNGNVSDISNTQVLEISEDLIDFTLYESHDYYKTDTPTFTEVCKAKSIEDIKVNKGETHSSIINTENIGIVPYEIDTDNNRLIYVTNIWNTSNRHLMNRDKKAYKAVNSYEGIQVESDIFTFKEAQEEVLIDKIVILKKDVTGLSDEERRTPLDIKDENTSVLKVFVRQGGKFYSDYFLGKDMETNDYDYPEYLVSSITLDSRFPLLKINDIGIRGNKYNYTMYLYDEDENISEPIVKVV